MAAVAEPVTGPTVIAVSELCRETGQHVILGMAEREGNALYNSALLIGPNGLAGKYRQLHLDRCGRMWATPGNLPLTTFDIPLGRIGLLVGHDINFPEASRLLSLDGADVVCTPAALTFPAPAAVEPTQIAYPQGVNVNTDPLHWILWRQRATDDSTYIAVANQYGEAYFEGETYLGLSGIFTPADIYGPRVEALAPDDGEAVVTIEIDTTSKDRLRPSNPVRLKEFLGLRQPLWYTLCQAKQPPLLTQGKQRG